MLERKGQPKQPPSESTNMNADLAPPEYTDLPVGSAELPPDYSTGINYVIGGHKLDSPLVRISQVKVHLSLLRAIHTLRTTIEAGKDARIPPEALALSETQRWGWFVGLAVER